ncbi:hypothetical protein [Pseudomonas fluorescens]|uniref:hypothetical protein n=1 Tax=Pseudomonas fluorescens TaxID=294 RepID=UPI0012429D69|nr:hypothetical protein [Pseudomonas fluorescens]VVQ26985.1 hypothetical protein PS947_00160 [Pseudomonas fluorescens]
MRYMKVSGQVSVEGTASVESRIVEFYESGINDAVYQAKMDRFGNLQKTSTDKIGFEGLASLIEPFISKANLDIKRSFDRHHSGNPNGKSMVLIAEGHTAEGTATGVTFRFFAEDGKLKHEVLHRPETDLERKSRRKLEAQERIKTDLLAKRRGVQPPPICETEDRSFMDRLCKSYIQLGW